jgi:hypothetical protein
LQRTIPGSKMCGNWFLILTSTSISMKISSWNPSDKANETVNVWIHPFWG